MILVTGGLGMIGAHTARAGRLLALAGRHDISNIVHLAGSLPDEDPVCSPGARPHHPVAARNRDPPDRVGPGRAG